ncbi:MAG: thioredoxin family protein [Nitriliruptor sp.]|uniref:thioredoxin family protein n=1 Tax=Nitriliruptor sp. TaxID=2448056 RepID=UPI00349FEA63
MSPIVLRLLIVLAVVAAASLAGWWWNRRDGRVRTVADDAPRVSTDHLAAVGLDLDGAAAGAVLLGSPTCTPCVAVERVLGELSADRPDFRWVKVDAADHLDLAEAHKVLRVPTLLVVDRDRRLVARTTGVPASADLAAVLDGDADLDRAGAAA